MSFYSVFLNKTSQDGAGFFSFGKYFVQVLNGMAAGLFSSLIIGLILKQLGGYSGLIVLTQIGSMAQYMMGPAIGVGVAMALNAPSLVVAAALACGALGAGTVTVSGAVIIGEPVGALMAALFGTLTGLGLWGRTQLNMILVPAAVLLVGGTVGLGLAPYITELMKTMGAMINAMTHLHPVPMGLFVAVTMGILLTLPVSSAAIAISLGLSGLAAGAATVGCVSHMVGFAVTSYRDNGYGGFIAQGLGTSMLQIGNVVKNPWIAFAPVVSSGILGVLATTFFGFKNSPVGAGMGTAGLVGPIAALDTMGTQAWLDIVVLCFLLPGVLCFAIHRVVLRLGLVRAGDMKLS